MSSKRSLWQRPEGRFESWMSGQSSERERRVSERMLSRLASTLCARGIQGSRSFFHSGSEREFCRLRWKSLDVLWSVARKSPIFWVWSGDGFLVMCPGRKEVMRHGLFSRVW